MCMYKYVHSHCVVCTLHIKYCTMYTEWNPVTVAVCVVHCSELTLNIREYIHNAHTNTKCVVQMYIGAEWRIQREWNRIHRRKNEKKECITNHTQNERLRVISQIVSIHGFGKHFIAIYNYFLSFTPEICAAVQLYAFCWLANNIVVFSMFNLNCMASENHLKAPKNDKCMFVPINESHTNTHTFINYLWQYRFAIVAWHARTWKSKYYTQNTVKQYFD